VGRERQPYKSPEACPLCGGALTEITVKASTGGGTGHWLEAKFLRDGKFFSSKSDVISLACGSCGHVLFFLADRSIIAP
jgi:hypothetical protein